MLHSEMLHFKGQYSSVSGKTCVLSTNTDKDMHRLLTPMEGKYGIYSTDPIPTTSLPWRRRGDSLPWRLASWAAVLRTHLRAIKQELRDPYNPNECIRQYSWHSEKKKEKNEGEKARPLPHSYSYIQTSAESESILSKLPLSKQA